MFKRLEYKYKDLMVPEELLENSIAKRITNISIKKSLLLIYYIMYLLIFEGKHKYFNRFNKKRIYRYANINAYLK